MSAYQATSVSNFVDFPTIYIKTVLCAIGISMQTNGASANSMHVMLKRQINTQIPDMAL